MKYFILFKLIALILPVFAFSVSILLGIIYPQYFSTLRMEITKIEQNDFENDANNSGDNSSQQTTNDSSTLP